MSLYRKVDIMFVIYLYNIGINVMKSCSIVKRSCQLVYDFCEDKNFDISLTPSVIAHPIIKFMKYNIL